MGGPNQFARFAKDVAGTPQQETNLNAVLGALPNGQPAQVAMADLLEALRATGQRKPMGSATSFNEQVKGDLGDIPLTASGRARRQAPGSASSRMWTTKSAERGW